MAKSEKSTQLDQWIGSRVFRARLRSGLTVGALAERAGVHRNTLDRLENGFGVTVHTLCSIAIALHTELDALIPLSQYIVLSLQE